MKKLMAAVLVSFLATLMAMSAEEFLGSIYRNDSIAAGGATQAFTVVYTNDTGSKVALASVFANSSLATNSWSISVVNNGQTNVLTAPTALTYVTTGVKYEGYGTVPLGAGGKVIVSGTVATNAGGTLVQWQVHTK